MPKIKRLDVNVEGDKRTRVPFAIEWKCPKCGKEHVRDCRDRYFSYPIWGQTKKEHLYCDECEHEEPILLKVDVTVTIEEDEI